jgi:4-alpha-glucanotransferase
MGECAYRFVDQLSSAGQQIWQVLPLGPPGFGESPYQCFSAFAGNPLLIGLDRLADEGWLALDKLESEPVFDPHTIDFGRVRALKQRWLRAAFEAFERTASPANRTEFDEFRHEQAWWLNDYALFAAIKHRHSHRAWTLWDVEYVTRQPAALKAYRQNHGRDVEFEEFLQFLFDRQWNALKDYANRRGVRVMGDLPIFVAHDSADVWAEQHLFSLDARGEPTVVAGVPPDYFCVTGQRWGNPLYRWDVMRREGYSWWVNRIRHTLSQFDLVRIDHFRGFEGYWEVPAEDATAERGRWMPGPGESFFQHVLAECGKLPLVAEDLGVITPPVEALRDEFEFPGMRVLQFAFGEDPKASDYQPHSFSRHCVVYTGTHDNDTTLGWFHSEAGESTTRTPRQVAEERARVLRYTGTDGHEIHWDMIRLALASVADTAIIPLQDVLGLGTSARMNLPGTAGGNWHWRFGADELTPACLDRLGEMTTTYGRSPPQ